MSKEIGIKKTKSRDLLTVEGRKTANKNLTFRLKKGTKIRNTGRTRFKKGQIAWNKGKKMSNDFCQKCKKRQLGKFVRSEEGKKSFKEKMSGSNNPNWIEDRTQIDMNKRRNWTTKCIAWRESVFKRDNYKCKICNKRGSYLEAHHILSWRDFPEERFNINNGITLCRAHHPRKRAEEKRLIPELQGLVSVSKECLL